MHYSIHWLSNEISSLNRQIKSMKDQVTFVIQQEETNPPLESNKTSRQFSSPRIQLKNERNIFILKLLVDEILFEGYLEELIDIYEDTPITMVIECIAILIDKDSIGKHLLIKLVNGNIDRYHMNRTKSLRETFWKMRSIDFTMEKRWENNRNTIEDLVSRIRKSNEMISYSSIDGNQK